MPPVPSPPIAASGRRSSPSVEAVGADSVEAVVRAATRRGSDRRRSALAISRSARKRANDVELLVLDGEVRDDLGEERVEADEAVEVGAERVEVLVVEVAGAVERALVRPERARVVGASPRT